MASKGKQRSTTHNGELYTRCVLCQERAYLVPDWRPAKGMDQRLRQFKCQYDHQTFKSLSTDVLFYASRTQLLGFHP